MSEKKEEMTLEMRLSAIDTIIGQMEQPDVSLDASFTLYKQGLEQVKAANDALDRMEKAMLVLGQDGTLEEF